MGLGPIHCGSFLLLVAFALLLVSSISSPVVNDISFLNVYNNGRAKMTFGVFGYCRDARSSNSMCSGRELGYNIAEVSGGLLSHNWSNSVVDHLTNVLILHPIAAGITFFAALIALCSDRLGFICSAFITFLAFIISLIAMVFDFVIFGIVKHEVNDNTNGSASYSTATWLTLAAVIILFFAQFIVFFECCTQGRRKNRDFETPYNSGGYVGNQAGMNGGYGARPWYGRFFNRNKY